VAAIVAVAALAAVVTVAALLTLTVMTTPGCRLPISIASGNASSNVMFPALAALVTALVAVPALVTALFAVVALFALIVLTTPSCRGRFSIASGYAKPSSYKIICARFGLGVADR